MPRLLRDAPLNGIWEGSGNVIALDVLRALSREPDGPGGVHGRVRARRAARNAALDAHLDALPADDRPVERAAGGRGARAGVPGVAARALRARRSSPTRSARRGLGGGGRVYGTLPAGVDGAAIVARALEID